MGGWPTGLTRPPGARPAELERQVRARTGPRPEAIEALAARLVGATRAVALVSYREITLTCAPDGLPAVLVQLRHLGFEQLIDVDLRPASGRPYLVHHLLSLSLNARVRVRTPVLALLLPTARAVYPNAARLERLAHRDSLDPSEWKVPAKQDQTMGGLYDY